jgi:hypothetical protein
MSVLPPTTVSTRRRLALALVAFVALIALFAAYFVWEHFYREFAQQIPAGVERYKYGSIGVEEQQGIPYWIWVVLPRVFPEHLPGPGGYASLGIVWEPGRELPVGFSKRHIGYDRVGFNCALCHTATYRKRHDEQRLEPTQIVPTGPAARFDAQGYLAFLANCAADPRFNSDSLMAAIEYNVKLPWSERLLYRYVLIPGTRKALIAQSKANQWMDSRPLWGHGRIDPFNPVKFGLLELPIDETVGNSDMMPLWQLNRRQAADGSYHLHWDGLVTKPIHASLSGALGDGATKKSLPVEQIEELTRWLSDDSISPPEFPFRVDSGKVKAGKALFDLHCVSCHGQEGQWQNLPWRSVAGLDNARTDDHRLAMWNTVQLRDPLNPDDERHPATRYRAFARGYPWVLDSFVGTTDYVATPLNGLWLRGPYLHNGSVPTIRDLLNKPLSAAQLHELLAKDKDPNTAGAFERLTDLLQRSAHSEIPDAQFVRILESFKPATDRLIDAARTRDRRPPVFYRGSDELDQEGLGFVVKSVAAEGRRFAVPFVTLVTGNSNSGHEYGTDLSKEEKEALVEFLKTYRIP